MKTLLLRVALGTTALVFGTAALGLALPAGASAAPRTVLRGKVAGLRWGVTAWGSTIPSGSSRLPSLCMNLSYDGGQGESVGAPAEGTLFGADGVGNVWCISPARGTTTAGPPWVFDIARSAYQGLTQPGVLRVKGASNTSTRWLLFFTDPRATRVVARLADGEQLRIQTHPVPTSLHRPSKVAVVATAKAPFSPAAMKVARAVAYDAHGKIVGRMPTKKSLQLAVFTDT